MEKPGGVPRLEPQTSGHTPDWGRESRVTVKASLEPYRGVLILIRGKLFEYRLHFVGLTGI